MKFHLTVVCSLSTSSFLNPKVHLLAPSHLTSQRHLKQLITFLSHLASRTPVWVHLLPHTQLLFKTSLPLPSLFPDIFVSGGDRAQSDPLPHSLCPAQLPVLTNVYQDIRHFHGLKCHLYTNNSLICITTPDLPSKFQTCVSVQKS